MTRIKIGMTLLFIVVSIQAFKSFAQNERGVQFLPSSSWKKILDSAKKEHKLIFIDAYATWCVPCTKMDFEVYTNISVGKIINSKFLAAKFQMDESIKDSPEIRILYNDALYLQKKYNIKTMPTFLFFDENGLLLHQDVGFKKPDDFLTMVADATDPQKSYGNQVRIYRSGIKDYTAILKLYFKTKRLKDNSFADTLATDLKSNYFEKIAPSKVFETEENLIFLGRNTNLFSSKDRLFKLFASKLKDTAKCMGLLSAANAEFFINTVVTSEEIITKMQLKHSENARPNWNQLEKNIKKKYPFVNAKKIIVYAKQDYYSKHGNWVEFAKAINELNVIVPPSLDGLDVFWRLNGPAWDMFEKTNDPFVLGEALKWVDAAIKLKPKQVDNLQFLDTRANILYRLGRINNAIDQEKQAVDAAQAQSQIQLMDVLKATLIKMKAGLPTWPTSKTGP